MKEIRRVDLGFLQEYCIIKRKGIFLFGVKVVVEFLLVNFFSIYSISLIGDFICFVEIWFKGFLGNCDIRQVMLVLGRYKEFQDIYVLGDESYVGLLFLMFLCCFRNDGQVREVDVIGFFQYILINVSFQKLEKLLQYCW